MISGFVTYIFVVETHLVWIHFPILSSSCSNINKYIQGESKKPGSRTRNQLEKRSAERHSLTAAVGGQPAAGKLIQKTGFPLL